VAAAVTAAVTAMATAFGVRGAGNEGQHQNAYAKDCTRLIEKHIYLLLVLYYVFIRHIDNNRSWAVALS
jgi:hypothetical protein